MRPEFRILNPEPDPDPTSKIPVVRKEVEEMSFIS